MHLLLDKLTSWSYGSRFCNCKLQNDDGSTKVCGFEIDYGDDNKEIKMYAHIFDLHETEGMNVHDDYAKKVCDGTPPEMETDEEHAAAHFSVTWKCLVLMFFKPESLASECPMKCKCGFMVNSTYEKGLVHIFNEHESEADALMDAASYKILSEMLD